MELSPKFKPGDRVLLLQHSDWKAPAVATVTRDGRPYTRSDGYEFIEYVITFDELQTDLTDEAAGHRIECEGTTVMEEFLQPWSGQGPA